MTDLHVRPEGSGRLLSRPLVLLLALSFGSLTSLYLLLPVVPLYVAAGGGGDVGAGAATGVMMLSTVLAELACRAFWHAAATAPGRPWDWCCWAAVRRR